MTTLLSLISLLNAKQADAQGYEKAYHFEKKASGLYVTKGFGDSRVENMDVKNAEVIYRDGHRACIKDDHKVCTYEMRGGKYNPEFVDTLEGADPKTIQVADEYFAFDKEHIYDFHAIKFPYDVSSLRIERIPTTKFLFFIIDKNIVVFDGTKELEGADPASFTIFNRNYCKDKNNVRYLFTWGGNKDVTKLDGIVARDAHLRNNDENIITDEKNVFIYGKKLEGADAASFAQFDGGFKDKNSVRIDWKKVDVSDPATFKTFDGDPLYKFEDKDFYYDGNFKRYPK